MQRDLASLAGSTHDLLIVGGGIHGAIAAWDATLRGLSVALVERDDFGGATSANSLKTVHGGLRYLQRADLRRMRQSIRERSTLLRIAPHLVQPLGFLVPTYGVGTRGRLALGMAMRVADAMGFDRNRGLAPDRRLPASRLVSTDECRGLFSGFAARGLTGAALWYDAQMLHSERLTLAFVQSAAAHGAKVANYTAAEALLFEERRVCGARIEDRIGGGRFEVRSRVVLNAAGPWAGDLLAAGPPAPGIRPLAPSMALAVNLVRRGRLADLALGLRSTGPAADDPVCGGGRYLFLAPWRGSTLIGTSYRLTGGPHGEARAGVPELQGLVDECNASCPELDLSLDDVTFYHRGLVPLKDGIERGRPEALAEESHVVDHEIRDRVPGLLSVIGVKYTTARLVAERIVDAVCGKLGRPSTGCRTADEPVWGGEGRPAGDGPVVERLAGGHGARATELAREFEARPGWARPVAPGAAVLEGEVRHAVRHEMALKLADVVLRRTDMGSEAFPGREALEGAARLLAEELQWDPQRREREIDEVRQAYRPLRVAERRG